MRIFSVVTDDWIVYCLRSPETMILLTDDLWKYKYYFNIVYKQSYLQDYSSSWNTYGKEISHLVWSCSKSFVSISSVMVNDVMFSVGEVPGLWDVVELSLSAEMGQRGQLWSALDHIFWQWWDVIDGFIFSINWVLKRSMIQLITVS